MTVAKFMALPVFNVDVQLGGIVAQILLVMSSDSPTTLLEEHRPLC